ncbi:hypoxia induced protein conserved region-domain-containing protein [Dipodascopsis uninucleata]
MVAPSSFDPYDPEDAVQNLRGLKKLWYHCKEQPLVPLGIFATCFALTKSGLAIRGGRSKSANRYFTLRVIFQGFTLAALVGGSYYLSHDTKSKEELMKEKAERRKKLWLEELDRQSRQIESYSSESKK